MPDWLEHVIYFVGSGNAFFAGAISILLAVVISIFATRRLSLLARNIAALVGVILVAISATPFPWWLYGVLALVTCVWLPLEWLRARVDPKVIVVVRVLTALTWLGAVAWEMQYHFTPTLPALGNPTLFVVGDSVSAGMRENDDGTWPKVFARKHRIDVRDLSKMGATVGSALKQCDRIGDETGLVLLEIGGNDLLGSTSADQFEERLDQLLSAVCRHERTIVMIELPLPPFCNRFGMIQRRLAAKYDALLVPKRVFIRVLTAADATVDGIHLSPTGHVLMADTIWDVVGGAYTQE